LDYTASDLRRSTCFYPARSRRSVTEKAGFARRMRAKARWSLGALPFRACGKQSCASQRFSPTPRCRRRSSIGHRIVHGGPKLQRHCLIDPSVLRQLEAAIAFAPLHIPLALSVIRFAQELFPGLPQVACFDTTSCRSGGSGTCASDRQETASRGASNATASTASRVNRSRASLVRMRRAA
jgi:hypothetical protein